MVDPIRILPDLQFSILCDDVRREHNGKLILLGLFETIGASRFPVQHPTLFVVNRWCNGVGEYRQRTVVRNPDNSILAEDQVTVVKLEDLKAKHKTVLATTERKINKGVPDTKFTLRELTKK